MSETEQLPNTQNQSPVPPVRYAVVVGINDYSGTGAANLDFCTNDADAIYEALITYADYASENIILFSDSSRQEAKPPRYSDILSEIRSMCARASDQDSILLFFAGHGTRDSQDSYLLTKDYRQNIIADSSISMQKVNDYFSESAAKFKLRFFDACHSGRMGHRGATPQTPDVEKHFAIEAEGWATLAACKEDQYAHEFLDLGHGAFSYFIIKGLSGAASIDNISVTLDNLKVYVLNEIIELSKKLGFTQTPVFCGEQAGNLMMSIISSNIKSLPAQLQQIWETDTKALEPAFNDTQQLLDDLTQLLVEQHPTDTFVANSNEEKIIYAETFHTAIREWALERVEERKPLSTGQDVFTVKEVNIEDAPLNLQNATFLFTSTARTQIEWEIRVETRSLSRKIKKTVEKQLSSMQWIMAPNQNRYETIEVDEPYYVEDPKGVTNVVGYPKTTTILMFAAPGHRYPNCAMNISVVPCTFGLYLFCYFTATSLQKQMKEEWNPNSFSTRLFFALAMNNDTKQVIIEQLSSKFAEFVSFIGEHIKARQLLFEKLGAFQSSPILQ